MLNLTSEQNALFALLRGDTPSESEIDWDEVRREAQKQSVFCMLPQPEGLTPEQAAAWQNASLTGMRSNMEAFYAVSEMDRLMREAGEDYVILKGLASASYYPDWFSRALGDVDFLIDPNHQKKVEEVLETAGYQREPGLSDHHVAFQKKGQTLEMHFNLNGVPDGELGDIVSDYLKDLRKEPLLYSANGKEYYIPQPKYHGLIILLHMQHHMTSGGIGLRHLIDWCYFVNQTEKEPFWQADLLPVLQKIGLIYFAAVITKAGACCLRTAEPDWCGREKVEEQLCDELMQDILAGGNFGRKDAARQGSSLLLEKYDKKDKTHSTIVRLWKTVLGGAAGYHPVVKKVPVLYPIFIADFLWRRLKHVATGQRQPLWKSARFAEERKSVYDRLKLFQVQ